MAILHVHAVLFGAVAGVIGTRFTQRGGLYNVDERQVFLLFLGIGCLALALTEALA
jgi:hypothetical protein